MFGTTIYGRRTAFASMPTSWLKLGLDAYARAPFAVRRVLAFVALGARVEIDRRDGDGTL
jgi:hypothetical protein